MADRPRRGDINARLGQFAAQLLQAFALGLHQHQLVITAAGRPRVGQLPLDLQPFAQLGQLLKRPRPLQMQHHGVHQRAEGAPIRAIAITQLAGAAQADSHLGDTAPHDKLMLLAVITLGTDCQLPALTWPAKQQSAPLALFKLNLLLLGALGADSGGANAVEIGIHHTDP